MNGGGGGDAFPEQQPEASVKVKSVCQLFLLPSL